LTPYETLPFGHVGIDDVPKATSDVATSPKLLLERTVA